MSDATTSRYVMALYYAYGRADASSPSITTGGRRTLVDPIAFAEFYMARWEEFTTGQSSHMPSVQDSWDTYRRSLAS